MSEEGRLRPRPKRTWRFRFGGLNGCASAQLATSDPDRSGHSIYLGAEAWPWLKVAGAIGLLRELLWTAGSTGHNRRAPVIC